MTVNVTKISTTQLVDRDRWAEAEAAHAVVGPIMDDLLTAALDRAASHDDAAPQVSD